MTFSMPRRGDAPVAGAKARGSASSGRVAPASARTLATAFSPCQTEIEHVARHVRQDARKNSGRRRARSASGRSVRQPK